MKPRVFDNSIDPGTLITRADALAPYHRNRRRLVWVYAFVLIVAVIGTLYFRQQNARIDKAAHVACHQRVVAVTRLNAFYTGMIKLEQSNKFIDQKLRDQRVALYRDVVLTVPKC